MSLSPLAFSGFNSGGFRRLWYQRLENLTEVRLNADEVVTQITLADGESWQVIDFAEGTGSWTEGALLRGRLPWGIELSFTVPQLNYATRRTIIGLTASRKPLVFWLTDNNGRNWLLGRKYGLTQTQNQAGAGATGGASGFTLAFRGEDTAMSYEIATEGISAPSSTGVVPPTIIAGQNGAPGAQGAAGVGFVRWMKPGNELPIQPVNSRSSTFHHTNDRLTAIPFRVDREVTIDGVKFRTSGTTTDPLATLEVSIFSDDFANLGYIYPKDSLRTSGLVICNPAGTKHSTFADLTLSPEEVYWAVYQSYNGSGGTLISHASTGYQAIAGTITGSNDFYGVQATGQTAQTMPTTFPSGAVGVAPGNQPLAIMLTVAT